MKKIVSQYLQDNNYDLESSQSTGIMINLINDELNIRGSKQDLIELADYIVDVALSKEEKDHIHLDDLSLISTSSNIKDMTIEKE